MIFIDARFTKVSYSSFDTIVNLVIRLEKGALCGKRDIQSAIRLLKVYPGGHKVFRCVVH